MMILDRFTPPSSSSFDEGHELLQARTEVLQNGIPLHLILSGTQPLVRLEIIFDAGVWEEEVNNSSYITSKLLSSGTSKWNAKQIENTIAFYGAFLDLENGPDRSVITVYTLAKHLETLLPLIVDLIENTVFPEDEILNLKNITLQNLQINKSKTSYLASTEFRKSIFGKDHPYGKSLEEEFISQLSKQDIEQFYNRYFTIENCNIVVSGNGELDFVKVIDKYLGVLGKRGSRKNNDFRGIQVTKGRINLPKADNLQTSIRIGRPMFRLDHSDYFNAYIFTEVLGGYFGSRLMKNIREDKGFTYGIHANIVCHKREGYFVIGTDVNKENTEETLQEIYKEIELLKKEPVTKDELETVKQYMLGAFYNSINTPFALADKFKMIHFNDLNYSFFKNYVAAIHHITPDHLLKIGNKYFQKEEMIEIVAGIS